MSICQSKSKILERLRQDPRLAIECFVAQLPAICGFYIAVLNGVKWVLGYLLAMAITYVVVLYYFKKRKLKGEELRQTITSSALKLLLSERFLYIALALVSIAVPTALVASIDISLGFVIGIVTWTISALGILRMLGHIERVDLGVLKRVESKS